MNVFKYGAETATFEKLFDFIMSINDYVGLKFRKNKPSALDVLKAVAISAPTLSAFTFLIVSAVTDTDLEVIGSCLLVLSAGLGNIGPKFLTLLFGSKRLKELMKIVVLETNEESIKYADEVHKGLLRKYSSIAKIVTNIELCSFIFTFFLLYVSPYFISIATSSWISPLNIQIIGVSATSHPGYEIHILLTEYFVAYNMTLIGTLDIIFFYFTLYISYQLDVCKHLVSFLSDKKYGQITATSLLRRIAVLHSNLCKFCKDCSRFFQWVILFEVVSISLCLSVSLTMHHVNPWLYTMAIQVVSLQFLILCMFAEMVNTKTLETSRAFYLSAWNDLKPIADRKSFLMLLQFSQTSLSFSPFGLIILSLETFVKVIRAAFGYYTFLKSVI